MIQPLVIHYTNLLHKYRDPNARPVKDFLKKHSKDKVLQKLEKALNKVLKLKQELV